MFRTNDQHKQQTLLESTQWMNLKIKEKLEKSWAPIFYEQVFCHIDEQPFSILYSNTGTPNFPVNILLGLEYIKHMKNISDAELLDDFYFDYLVNYAVGIRTLGETHLAERTLYYFRERIYQYTLKNPKGEDLLFGQFKNLLKNFAEKASIHMNEQRTDTTMFMSNIKKAGRISLAYDVLVKAVKAIPENSRTENLKKVLEPSFKTETLYHAKAQENDGKLIILLNLCREALEILNMLPNTNKSEAQRILSRFIREQTTTDTNGELLPKQNKEISSGSLQSAYDEDATHRTKGNKSQSGYVLGIAETCGPDNPFQLITDYTIETNNTSDVAILKNRMEAIHDTGCKDLYADGGYYSNDVAEEAETNKIKMHLTDMTGKKTTKKLPVTDFEIDEKTNLINKCPGGHTPTRVAKSDGQSTAHMPHSACENCPLKEQCYVKRQKKDYSLRINLKSIIAGRERVKIQEFKKENTSKRAGIEGTNSALKRKGHAKLNVCGITKISIVSALKVAAQNICRVTKYLLGGYKSKKKPSYGIFMPIPA